jgi:hypothetical protein
LSNYINRKQFLKFLSLIGTASGLTALSYQNSLVSTVSQVVNNKIFLPIIQSKQGSTPGIGPKVVHVHHANATFWDFIHGWYGDYVNQDLVNQMVDEGLKTLTAKPSVREAWNSLLPGYKAGKATAIKVNYNNTFQCNGTGNLIDALMEPVNALIRGMLDLGVLPSDIWVFDASRPLPTRFRNKCPYPGIRFFDARHGGCAEPATFNSSDPSAQVIFHNPYLNPRRVTDVIINASYLINMPILKDHSAAGVSLGFKNHFGTIDQITGNDPDNLHLFMDPTNGYYRSDSNPLVDIYANPHIINKTILCMGDGLFGCLGTQGGNPGRWQTFANKSPNSFFLSTDPVAIDCIMLDILDAEPWEHPRRPSADDYLKLAAEAGMGVYERGDPWNPGYQNIDYIKIELP